MVKPTQLRVSIESKSLTGNLVSESLRLDYCDVVDDTLVGVEIVGESIIRLINGCTYFP